MLRISFPLSCMYFSPEFLQLAQKQQQLMSRRQAVPTFMSAPSWSRRHTSGLLERAQPGVSRLVGSVQSPEQQIQAALLSIGRGSIASHRSAAHLWGLKVCGHEPIDVVVPDRSVEMTREGVLIHQPTDAADLRPTKRQGIRCAGALRTLCDLGAVVDPTVVAASLEKLVVSRVVSFNNVCKALERHEGRGRAGAGVLRGVLADWSFGARPPDSVLEVRLAKLLSREGLTGVTFHHGIRVGRKRYVIDAAFVAEKLAIEVDGWEFHGRRWAFEGDRSRDVDLASIGWQTLRFTWRRVIADRSGVGRDIRSVLGERRRR